jgi:hypothetical protein
LSSAAFTPPDVFKPFTLPESCPQDSWNKAYSDLPCFRRSVDENICARVQRLEMFVKGLSPHLIVTNCGMGDHSWSRCFAHQLFGSNHVSMEWQVCPDSIDFQTTQLGNLLGPISKRVVALSDFEYFHVRHFFTALSRTYEIPILICLPLLDSSEVGESWVMSTFGVLTDQPKKFIFLAAVYRDYCSIACI